MIAIFAVVLLMPLAVGGVALLRARRWKRRILATSREAEQSPKWVGTR